MLTYLIYLYEIHDWILQPTTIIKIKQTLKAQFQLKILLQSLIWIAQQYT